MGITISVPSHGITMHTNNMFAANLEATFGGDEVPEGFFRQGLEDMDPIVLSPAECATLADALDGLSDADLDARFRRYYDPGMDDDYVLAIEFIRELTDLAGLNAGMEVR